LRLVLVDAGWPACGGPLCQRFEPSNGAAVVPARYKLPGPAGPGAEAQVELAAAGWDAGSSRHPNALSPPGTRAKSTPPTLQPGTSPRRIQGKEETETKHRDVVWMLQVDHALHPLAGHFMRGACGCCWHGHIAGLLCRPVTCPARRGWFLETFFSSVRISVFSVPLWFMVEILSKALC